MSTSTQRMTKHELAKQVAANAGLTGEQATSAVDAAFDAIAGELVAGRDVAIAGFGKFSVGERSLSSSVRRFLFGFSERRPRSCRLAC